MDKIIWSLKIIEGYVGFGLAVAIVLIPIVLAIYYSLTGDWASFGRLLNSIVNRPLP